MSVAYENKIPNNKDAFVAKLKTISEQLQTNPDWIMAVMEHESHLDPSAQNTTYPLHNGPATGLIQFTPDTANYLGTSISQLVLMDNVTQLDWVEKYLSPYTGHLNSYFDVYMSVFFPAAIGKPDDWIIETKYISRSTIARQNHSIDFNKDGQITVEEFKKYLNNTIPLSLRDLIFGPWTTKKK